VVVEEEEEVEEVEEEAEEAEEAEEEEEEAVAGEQQSLWYTFVNSSWPMVAIM